MRQCKLRTLIFACSTPTFETGVYAKENTSVLPVGLYDSDTVGQGDRI